MKTRSLLSFILAGALAVAMIGCGGSGPSSRSPSAADEPPLPVGKGTKRALVLVDDDGPPSAKPVTEDDALSTRRIVQKVMLDSPGR